MRAIIYQTNTGTTERYAKLLAQQTDLPCAALEEADFPEDTEIVFLGWIFSDKLQGLEAVRQKYSRIVAVGAVGLFSLEKPDEVKEKLGVAAPLVLLPGVFDPKKLKGMMRLAFSMLKRALQAKGANSESEQTTLRILETGVDSFDEAALAPLIALLRGEALPDCGAENEEIEVS